jgi:hypothetical protein
MGHEHNVHHSRVDGTDSFVTGGGRNVWPGRPGTFAEAGTAKWAPAGHFLLVRIDGMRVELTPIGEDGRPLATVDPQGRPSSPAP